MPTSIASRLAAAVFLLAVPMGARGQARDSAAFITMSGSDTVSVERWVREGDRWEAAVLDKGPVPLLRRYTMELNRRGRVQRFEQRWHDAGDPTGAPSRTMVLQPREADWYGRITQHGGTREGLIAADVSALPYRYREHWLLEAAISRVRRGATRTLPMIEGTGVTPLIIDRSAEGQVTIVQEKRAPYVARVDEAGRVLEVKMEMVPRSLVVTRVPWVEIDERARRWQATAFTPLPPGEFTGVGKSGGGVYDVRDPDRDAAPARGREEATVGGARIVVEYGKPSLRGRASWGDAVPWGQVWPVGGDQPARLTTSRELVLGGLVVPAGEYTLYALLEQGGGILILSRGPAEGPHDPARDLGNAPARRVQRVFSDEDFSIEVDPGAIRLIWGESEYVIPFKVP